MRKTKIVCTIGPSSDNEDIFRAMCKTGLNVARLNFSHGTHDEHKKTIEMIKKVREELNLPIAIMLDTKGPEYRIKTFENGKVFIPDGADFTFTARDVQGNENIVSVSYKGLPSDLSVGDKILVNNGLVSFEVVAIDGTEIKCRTLIGGELSNRKSMSFPGKTLRQIYLGEQDKADLLFGIKNGVSFIAASFVSCKQDLVDLKTFLKENGGENIDIIAKIENRSGIENIEDICSECEGIMIGRGDLGVEIPFAEVPAVQKYLITKCRLLGKRVITATEMLESMIQNPRPTARKFRTLQTPFTTARARLCCRANRRRASTPSKRCVRCLISSKKRNVTSTTFPASTTAISKSKTRRTRCRTQRAVWQSISARKQSSSRQIRARPSVWFPASARRWI